MKTGAMKFTEFLIIGYTADGSAFNASVTPGEAKLMRSAADPDEVHTVKDTAAVPTTAFDALRQLLDELATAFQADQPGEQQPHPGT